MRELELELNASRRRIDEAEQAEASATVARERAELRAAQAGKELERLAAGRGAVPMVRPSASAWASRRGWSPAGRRRGARSQRTRALPGPPPAFPGTPSARHAPGPGRSRGRPARGPGARHGAARRARSARRRPRPACAPGCWRPRPAWRRGCSCSSAWAPRWPSSGTSSTVCGARSPANGGPRGRRGAHGGTRTRARRTAGARAGGLPGDRGAARDSSSPLGASPSPSPSRRPSRRPSLRPRRGPTRGGSSPSA